MASIPVSIPNGLFKSFRRSRQDCLSGWSRCFNPKRAFQVIPTRRLGHSNLQFQSQTGFSSHSDSRYLDRPRRSEHCFNPKRAFQVIPTSRIPNRCGAGWKVSIPNGLFKSFRLSRVVWMVGKDVRVSIPNGLFKSFRLMTGRSDALCLVMVSIPNGLFKSFRHWLRLTPIGAA